MEEKKQVRKQVKDLGYLDSKRRSEYLQEKTPLWAFGFYIKLLVFKFIVT